MYIIQVVLNVSVIVFILSVAFLAVTYGIKILKEK